VIALLLSACPSPIWQADVKSFVDDGLSTVSLREATARSGGAVKSVIPSGEETVVTVDLLNPRSIPLSVSACCKEVSLLSSGPSLAVVNPKQLLLRFTPTLAAEHTNLEFSIAVSAPALNRTYEPMAIVLPCNTPPGSIASTVHAALDGSGYGFAAFRLPSTPTDDDLSQVEITWGRADGVGGTTATTLAAGAPSLLANHLTAAGEDPLGTDNPLDRYYQPPTAGMTAGLDYVFTVVLIDGGGLRSDPAPISTNATLYTVSYDGNGSTTGSPPVDSLGYWQTRTVRVLDEGSLVRAGYAFSGWNAAANGTGTAYAAGATFAMGASNVTLYAQWGETYTVTYDGNWSTAGSPPIDPSSYLAGAAVTVLGNPGGLAEPDGTWVGWNTAPDGSGTNYAPGPTLTMGSVDVTLYARWQGDYTVSQPGQAGGIVFYDKGYFSDGWRFLEAATSDQSGGIAWGVSGTVGAYERVIGAGKANTALIVSVLGRGWTLSDFEHRGIHRLVPAVSLRARSDVHPAKRHRWFRGGHVLVLQRGRRELLDDGAVLKRQPA